MIADGKTYGRGLPWPRSLQAAVADAGSVRALSVLTGVPRWPLREWSHRYYVFHDKRLARLKAVLGWSEIELPLPAPKPKPGPVPQALMGKGCDMPVGYPSRGDVIVETLLKQVGQMTAKMPYAPVPPLFPKHYDILDILCDSFRLTDEAIEAARLAFCEPDRQRVPVGEPMESAGVAPAALVAATHPSV